MTLFTKRTPSNPSHEFGKNMATRVFGLPERPNVPLLAVISRLAAQKDIDLIAESLDAILGLDAQFVLLGTGEPALHQAFEAAEARHPSRVGLKLGFDVALSHKIEAGADMFLMSSRYEPCGLNQMYSLAYGTIPLVRATGGLDDTIQRFDPETGVGNGFKFAETRADALLLTAKQAIALYHQRERWLCLMKNAMDCGLFITFMLNLMAMLIILMLAIPIGISSATHQNTLYDKITTTTVFVGFAMPSFWLALLLMILFGVYLDWLPISGLKSMNYASLPFWGKVLDLSRHLVLPLFVIAFGGFAGDSRYMRSSMLEVIRQDYVTVARAKGLPEKTVIYRHAFRNALLPLITLMGLSVPGLIGGSVLPSALIVGGEASGASREAVKLATKRISIPLSRDVESLKAAVAASVILFEAERQRKSE